MQDRDPNIVNSGLSRTVTRDAHRDQPLEHRAKRNIARIVSCNVDAAEASYILISACTVKRPSTIAG